MSLVFALLLQVASHSAPTYGAAEQTPETKTSSALTFDCDLADSSKKFYKLSFERLGGRGYWSNTKSAYNAEQQAIGRTPFFIRTILDETRSLSAFSGPQNANQGTVVQFYFGDSSQNKLGFLRAIPENQSQSTVAYIVVDETPRFTGHCVVTPTTQSQLSDEETELYKFMPLDSSVSLELIKLKKAVQSDKIQ